MYVDWLRIWIYLDRGERDLSRKLCKSWEEEAIRVFPRADKYIKSVHHFALGSTELTEAKTDSAKKRLTEIKALLPAIANQAQKKIAAYFHDCLQAEVFLSEGFSEKCITVLERTISPTVPSLGSAVNMAFYNVPFLKDTLARAYKQKGDLDNAIAAYEKLIVFDPDSPDRFLIHPVYHYRLAKLYEEKGWEGKAIDEYENFLDLWRDADPRLPEIKDAKTRLAGLKSN